MADDRPAPVTLRYRTTRAEIWAWYWREWRRRFWIFWLLGGVAVGGIVLGDTHDPLLAAGAVAALFAAFAAWPQLSFKRQDRTLVLGPDGIDTTIGAKHAIRPWREIGEVRETAMYVVLTVAATGNAFLIPYRAFRNDAERRAVLDAIAKWRAAARA